MFTPAPATPAAPPTYTTSASTTPAPVTWYNCSMFMNATECYMFPGCTWSNASNICWGMFTPAPVSTAAPPTYTTSALTTPAPVTWYNCSMFMNATACYMFPGCTWSNASNICWGMFTPAPAYTTSAPTTQAPVAWYNCSMFMNATACYMFPGCTWSNASEICWGMFTPAPAVTTSVPAYTTSAPTTQAPVTWYN